MQTVTSQDGTTIAYDQYGQGPILILVTGALGKRSPGGMDEDLAHRLSAHFTVIDYDRRGRGDSTDTLPYAVDREIEDIEALIDMHGGSAYLYGLSSGAVLALRAADKLGAKVSKIALYEPPLILDNSRPPVPADYVDNLNAAIAAGDPGKAIELFMTDALRLPAEYLPMMRNPPPEMQAQYAEGVKPPFWADMESVAHTLAYDGFIARDFMRGEPLPAGIWSGVQADALVIAGENSELFFHSGAQALVDALPHATYYKLPGQDHAVSPVALAPVLDEYFTTGKVSASVMS